MNSQPSTCNTWIEVDAGALAHNLRAVRGLLTDSTRLLAVVKANAYGHGPQAARVLADAGADMLAVTHLAEALEVRDAGVRSDILVFSPLLPDQFAQAQEASLTLTISSEEEAAWLSRSASSSGRLVDVHLKVDTGMGRLGVLPGEAPRLVRLLRSLPGIHLQGIYTHFPTAMSQDLAASRRQLGEFQSLLAALGTDRPPLAHCANSAATLQVPESHLDMVRVGTLLYGQFPASFLTSRLSLRPTWRMMSRIMAVKEIPAGWEVGYGSEYRAKKSMRVAVIPVGYADGFAVEVAARSRYSLKERARAILKALHGPARPGLIIHGRRAPVLGRIGMQMVTIDVTAIPDVHPGAPVEIPCRRVTSNSNLPRVLVEG